MSEENTKEISKMRPRHLRAVVAYTPLEIKKMKVRPKRLAVDGKKVIDE
jgi:hypothetical protein